MVLAQTKYALIPHTTMPQIPCNVLFLFGFFFAGYFNGVLELQPRETTGIYGHYKSPEQTAQEKRRSSQKPLPPTPLISLSGVRVIAPFIAPGGGISFSDLELLSAWEQSFLVQFSESRSLLRPSWVCSWKM